MDNDFDIFWDSFQVPAEYTNRHHACYDLWCRQADSKKKAILADLQSHQAAGTQTKQRNPYFYLQDFATPKQQTLSFKEYYARYGTTEETDGWRRVFLPERQTTIYVKG